MNVNAALKWRGRGHEGPRKTVKDFRTASFCSKILTWGLMHVKQGV